MRDVLTYNNMTNKQLFFIIIDNNYCKSTNMQICQMLSSSSTVIRRLSKRLSVRMHSVKGT